MKKKHQMLWWNCLSWGQPHERKTAEDKFIRGISRRNHEWTAPQLRAHINTSTRRHVTTQTVQRNGHQTSRSLYFHPISLRFSVLHAKSEKETVSILCSYHSEAWRRRRSDVVGVLWWWRCWWFSQNSWDTGILQLWHLVQYNLFYLKHPTRLWKGYLTK